MITVDEALHLILERSGTKAPASVSVAEALDLVLAEDVASDIDSPPWDKSMVDGYALRSIDVAQGTPCLAIIEEVVAGAVPAWPVGPGEATRIMTGAPLPAGADAVVMIEKTALVPAGTRTAEQSLGQVEIHETGVKPGQNILRQGCALRRGDTVLGRGTRIRPIEIGLLSEVGRTSLLAYPRPRVAILSTGNELVPPDRVPAAGQIRNSNGPLLAACVARAGGEPLGLGIARDERDELRRKIGAGLAADVVVLSGGVSAGVLDLVPQVLAELGAEEVFHKVRLKPGKPLWFGVARARPLDTLVFGLPGNPVSSLVCFELFVRPAMGRLAGRQNAGLEPVHARLTRDFEHRGDRPTYHPARVATTGEETIVTPLAWQGSADLRGLVEANALLHFPAGNRRYNLGDLLEALLL